MIEEDTVFILGAGASTPYCLPTSSELNQEIISNFANRINMLVKSREPSKAQRMYQEALDFTNALYGSRDSIDLWLMNNTKFLEMGKHAIITYILQGENKVNLKEKIHKPEQDWYRHLWTNMKDDDSTKQNHDTFSRNKIDFITFNYDRSLEQYLIDCIAYRFHTHNISDDDIIKQLKSRRIIHIYGKIANLNWESGQNFLPYGQNPGNIWLAKYNRNIKVIDEAENSKEVNDAILLIEKAKRIFFLGFGYRKENLKLLQLPNILNRNQKIFGTALGYRDNEIKKIFNLLIPPVAKNQIFDYRNIKIEDCDCLELLKRHL